MGRLGDHPHIVTIYDIGEDSGEPYVVQQFMAGGDVEALEQPLPHSSATLEIAKGVAEGWRSRTRKASCTATSSPATSGSRPTASRRSATSGSPSPSTARG